MAVIKQNTDTVFYGTLVIYKNAEGIELKWVNQKDGPDAFIITKDGISLSSREIVEKFLKEQEAQAKEQQPEEVEQDEK